MSKIIDKKDAGIEEKTSSKSKQEEGNNNTIPKRKADENRAVRDKLGKETRDNINAKYTGSATHKKLKKYTGKVIDDARTDMMLLLYSEDFLRTEQDDEKRNELQETIKKSKKSLIANFNRIATANRKDTSIADIMEEAVSASRSLTKLLKQSKLGQNPNTDDSEINTEKKEKILVFSETAASINDNTQGTARESDIAGDAYTNVKPFIEKIREAKIKANKTSMWQKVKDRMLRKVIVRDIDIENRKKQVYDILQLVGQYKELLETDVQIPTQKKETSAQFIKRRKKGATAPAAENTMKYTHYMALVEFVQHFGVGGNTFKPSFDKYDKSKLNAILERTETQCKNEALEEEAKKNLAATKTLSELRQLHRIEKGEDRLTKKVIQYRKKQLIIDLIDQINEKDGEQLKEESLGMIAHLTGNDIETITLEQAKNTIKEQVSKQVNTGAQNYKKAVVALIKKNINEAVNGNEENGVKVIQSQYSVCTRLIELINDVYSLGTKDKETAKSIVAAIKETLITKKISNKEEMESVATFKGLIDYLKRKADASQDRINIMQKGGVMGRIANFAARAVNKRQHTDNQYARVSYAAAALLFATGGIGAALYLRAQSEDDQNNNDMTESLQTPAHDVDLILSKVMRGGEIVVGDIMRATSDTALAEGDDNDKEGPKKKDKMSKDGSDEKARKELVNTAELERNNKLLKHALKKANENIERTAKKIKLQGNALKKLQTQFKQFKIDAKKLTDEQADKHKVQLDRIEAKLTEIAAKLKEKVEKIGEQKIDIEKKGKELEEKDKKIKEIKEKAVQDVKDAKVEGIKEGIEEGKKEGGDAVKKTPLTHEQNIAKILAFTAKRNISRIETILNLYKKEGKKYTKTNKEEMKRRIDQEIKVAKGKPGLTDGQREALNEKGEELKKKVDGLETKEEGKKVDTKKTNEDAKEKAEEEATKKAKKALRSIASISIKLEDFKSAGNKYSQEEKDAMKNSIDVKIKDVKEWPGFTDEQKAEYDELGKKLKKKIDGLETKDDGKKVDTKKAQEEAKKKAEAEKLVKKADEEIEKANKAKNGEALNGYIIAINALKKAENQTPNDNEIAKKKGNIYTKIANIYEKYNNPKDAAENYTKASTNFTKAGDNDNADKAKKSAEDSAKKIDGQNESNKKAIDAKRILTKIALTIENDKNAGNKYKKIAANVLKDSITKRTEEAKKATGISDDKIKKLDEQKDKLIAVVDGNVEKEVINPFDFQQIINNWIKKSIENSQKVEAAKKKAGTKKERTLSQEGIDKMYEEQDRNYPPQTLEDAKKEKKQNQKNEAIARQDHADAKAKKAERNKRELVSYGGDTKPGTMDSIIEEQFRIYDALHSGRSNVDTNKAKDGAREFKRSRTLDDLINRRVDDTRNLHYATFEPDETGVAVVLPHTGGGLAVGPTLGITLKKGLDSRWRTTFDRLAKNTSRNQEDNIKDARFNQKDRLLTKNFKKLDENSFDVSLMAVEMYGNHAWGHFIPLKLEDANEKSVQGKAMKCDLKKFAALSKNNDNTYKKIIASFDPSVRYFLDTENGRVLAIATDHKKNNETRISIQQTIRNGNASKEVVLLEKGNKRGRPSNQAKNRNVNEFLKDGTHILIISNGGDLSFELKNGDQTASNLSSFCTDDPKVAAEWLKMQNSSHNGGNFLLGSFGECMTSNSIKTFRKPTHIYDSAGNAGAERVDRRYKWGVRVGFGYPHKESYDRPGTSGPTHRNFRPGNGQQDGEGGFPGT